TEYFFGDRMNVFDSRQIHDFDQKFVAAKSGHRVVSADTAGHPVPDLHQQFIAAIMTESIIDALESIKIDKHDSYQRLRSLGQMDGFLQMRFEQRAVWQ